MILKIEPKVQIFSPLARLPQYQTEGSAGMDLVPAIDKAVIIQPGETKKLGLGLRIWIDNPSVSCLLVPRSSLATKHGITLANAPGLVDSDYQGEWILALKNESDKAFRVNPGERIAQAVFIPVVTVQEFDVVESFEVNTIRGCGGFGSTGITSAAGAPGITG